MKDQTNDEQRLIAEAVAAGRVRRFSMDAGSNADAHTDLRTRITRECAQANRRKSIQRMKHDT